MKRCLNCRVRAKCLLCKDCWRLAIVAPLIVFGIQQLITHWLK